MTEPLLKLSTIVQHETIELASRKHPNGKLYELINLADLGPYEYAVTLNREAEVQQLLKLKKLTPAQENRLEAILDETMRMLIPKLEPAVLRELTSQQKQMITIAWVSKFTGQTQEDPQKPRRKPTTAASSRGSKSSTAATQKRGSTSRHGR